MDLESDNVTALEYESVADDAMEMAFILNKIDSCLREGCMCGDDEMSYEHMIAQLCKIMYTHNGCYKNWLRKNI